MKKPEVEYQHWLLEQVRAYEIAIAGPTREGEEKSLHIGKDAYERCLDMFEITFDLKDDRKDEE